MLAALGLATILVLLAVIIIVLGFLALAVDIPYLTPAYERAVGDLLEVAGAGGR